MYEMIPETVNTIVLEMIPVFLNKRGNVSIAPPIMLLKIDRIVVVEVCFF